MVDIPMLWGSGQSGGLGGVYVPRHSASLISHACMWVRRTVLKLTCPDSRVFTPRGDEKAVDTCLV